MFEVFLALTYRIIYKELKRKVEQDYEEKDRFVKRIKNTRKAVDTTFIREQDDSNITHC